MKKSITILEAQTKVDEWINSTGVRYFLRQLVEPSFRNADVLSHSEIPAGTKVTSLGLI